MQGSLKIRFLLFALGYGNSAVVTHMKVKYDDTEYHFAVKDINIKQAGVDLPASRIFQEPELGLRMSKCPFAVITYGVMGSVKFLRILMEIMDINVEELRYRVSSFAHFFP